MRRKYKLLLHLIQERDFDDDGSPELSMYPFNHEAERVGDGTNGSSERTVVVV
jgi:hypothetical protein